VKRDFDELERRRMTAARLLNRGLSQAEVARRVQVSRESVRRWKNRIVIQGSTVGLKKAGRAGRKAGLGTDELKRLEAILREGPEKAGFANGLWTLERIASIIRQEFSLDYHPGHVWWLLHRKLGWSCQRPIGRARERNEASIRDWKENLWPALKKKPK
jgi:putative transposase